MLSTYEHTVIFEQQCIPSNIISKASKGLSVPEHMVATRISRFLRCCIIFIVPSYLSDFFVISVTISLRLCIGGRSPVIPLSAFQPNTGSLAGFEACCFPGFEAGCFRLQGAPPVDGVVLDLTVLGFGLLLFVTLSVLVVGPRKLETVALAFCPERVVRVVTVDTWASPWLVGLPPLGAGLEDIVVCCRLVCRDNPGLKFAKARTKLVWSVAVEKLIRWLLCDPTRNKSLAAPEGREGAMSYTQRSKV
jgi:hypothetical protein